jgi:non-heme chloroperoxidase
VLVGAIPPLMLKTADNPDGTPIEVFDGLRAQVLADRSQLFADLSAPFSGSNRSGSDVSQGVRDEFWLMGMQVGLKAAYDCIEQFSESDFNSDLRRVDVPMLVIHGDDDQIVPFAVGGQRSADIEDGAVLKVYAEGAHGLPDTDRDRLHTDLLDFINS